jgi:hypothetical protein
MFPKVLVCVVFTTIVLFSATNGDGSQNINKFLNNQVIVSRQIMCVLEKSPCDQLGRQLKGKHRILGNRTQNQYYCILNKTFNVLHENIINNPS